MSNTIVLDTYEYIINIYVSKKFRAVKNEEQNDDLK